MAREIIQYRYFGNNDENNYPSNLTLDDLASGKHFENKSVIQLGVQTSGGVRMYLNGNTDNQGIVIDSTGIYELNVDGMTVITNVQFDKNTLTSATYIIIDVIYEGAGES